MRAHRALLVATALVATAPMIARADDRAQVPAKARALAERGRAYHEAGDYPQAIAAFTRAYVIAPSPALLFNLAQAYRLQGDCDDAALMYQRYLATGPSAEGRDFAETYLAIMERCVHKIALHIPTDDVPAIPAAQTTGTAAIASDAAMPSARKAQIEKDIGIGLGIGGGLALAGALYYTIEANSASNDVSDAETKGGKGKNVGALDDRGQSAETKARVLAIGGALGVAGGIVMYAIGRHDEPPPVAISPVHRGRGAAVSMQWAF